MKTILKVIDTPYPSDFNEYRKTDRLRKFQIDIQITNVHTYNADLTNSLYTFDQ